MSNKEIFVSLIVVADLADSVVYNRVNEAHGYLLSNYSDFEVILVSKAFTSKNQDHLEGILRTLPFVRSVKVAGASTDEVEYAAGAECSIGDVVILWDPYDFPVSLFSEALNDFHQGGEGCDRRSKWR